MFSSNQILEVSGDLGHENSIKDALGFAINLSGKEAFTRETNPAKCVFQTTNDGRFCIGKIWSSPKEGWSEFPFDYDLDIISKIIIQHLEKQKIIYTGGDGSHYKGFLMKTIPNSFAKEENGIINPTYGIVSFEPFTCFYHK